MSGAKFKELVHFMIHIAMTGVAALALAAMDASARQGTGKPEGTPSIFDSCPRDRCADGILLAREDWWSDSPCGPEAIVNAMRMMCHPEISSNDLFVNHNFWTDMGLGVRQLTKLLNRNFRDRNCPSGQWRWHQAKSERSYVDHLLAAASGDRVALALTQAKDEAPHWYLVEDVHRSGNSCRVVVRDGGGRGTIECRRFAAIANGMPFWIPTPNRAIIWFKRR